MNFTMVMIVCFSTSVCQAIFDDTKFSSYDECYESSRSSVSFMAEMYPDSSGEIRCLTGEELAIYKEYIEQGGKPQLTNPEPEPKPSTDA
jgi:hypothetical protein